MTVRAAAISPPRMHAGDQAHGEAPGIMTNIAANPLLLGTAERKAERIN
jgi:hypothetical protein